MSEPLRLADYHSRRPKTPTRLQELTSRRFERLVLLLVFLLYVGNIWITVVQRDMAQTVDQLQASVTQVSRDIKLSTEVGRGNRVVSCTDLALQAPAVAAALPQCAGAPKQ